MEVGVSCCIPVSEKNGYDEWRWSVDWGYSPYEKWRYGLEEVVDNTDLLTGLYVDQYNIVDEVTVDRSDFPPAGSEYPDYGGSYLHTLTEGEDFEAKEFTPGKTQFLWIAASRLKKYQEENNQMVEKYNQLQSCAPIRFMPDPTLYSVISKSCGEQLCGAAGDELDYPIAYPMVVEVTDDYGRPKNDVVVNFSVTEGSAHVTKPSAITGEVTLTSGGTEIQNEDVYYGAAMSSVVLDGVGAVKVEAEVSTGPVTVFNFKCVGDEKEVAVSGADMHEKCGFNQITGDGLWGTCISPDAKTYSMDPSAERKNLILEIDYLSDNPLNLTPADMEVIYWKIYDIFLKVGIMIDPYFRENPEDLRYPGSVIQQMDMEPAWGDNYSWLANMINQSTYSSGDLDYFLPYTRGLFGTECLVSPDEHNLGKWERNRLHIVILNGSFDNPDPDYELTFGRTVNLWGRGTSKQASGAGYFNLKWTEDNPESHESDIDRVGIYIFLGDIAQLTLAESWKCKDTYIGTTVPVNTYCDVMAVTIAHEIGHAIGLADLTTYDTTNIERQIMWKSGDYDVERYFGYKDMHMSFLSNENKAWDAYINLRKVLGREVVNYLW